MLQLTFCRQKNVMRKLIWRTMYTCNVIHKYLFRSMYLNSSEHLYIVGCLIDKAWHKFYCTELIDRKLLISATRECSHEHNTQEWPLPYTSTFLPTPLQSHYIFDRQDWNPNGSRRWVERLLLNLLTWLLTQVTRPLFRGTLSAT